MMISLFAAWIPEFNASTMPQPLEAMSERADHS